MEQRPRHYRCKLTAADLRLREAGHHPASVYVRGDKIVHKLDHWLSTLFDPANREQTLETLTNATEDPASDPASELGRRVAADGVKSCNERLAKYRAALDAGTDPVVVTGWIAEVTAERLRHDLDLRRSQERGRLNRPQIAQLLEAMTDLARILQHADPADRVEVYRKLGSNCSTATKKSLVSAESSPSELCTYLGVRGGT